MSTIVAALKKLDTQLTALRESKPQGWVAAERRLVKEFDALWAKTTQEDKNLWFYGVRHLEPSPSFAPNPGRPGRPRLLQKKQRRKRTTGNH
jgi:hypothetical protein